MSRYHAIPGFSHPLTETFAEGLFNRTPGHLWPAPFTGRSGVWEKEPIEVLELFRDRARRLIEYGDTSVIPWVLPPGPRS